MLSKRLTMILALGMMAGGAYAEKFIFGMAPEPYMPFTYVDSSGEWLGIEGDLYKALCEEMKAECEYKEMSWDGLMPALTEGKIDTAMAGFSITEERLKTLDFSDSYYDGGQVIVGAKSNTSEIPLVDLPDGSGQIADPAFFDGKIIGFQTATVHAAYADAYYKDADLKNYETGETVAADLFAGRVDYIITDKVTITPYLVAESGKDYEVKLELPQNKYLGLGTGMPVRKDDTETLNKLNTALKAIKDSGKLAEITEKWENTQIEN